MFDNHLKYSVSALALAGAALSASVSFAQVESQSGGDAFVDEEILVTAQRRVEKLGDVPVSISAVGQAEADRRSLATIEDIARITPNFNFTGTGNTIQRVAIRGVDSSAGSGTTGIYINDIPIQVRQIGFNAFDTFPLVFDLARVEVLRGPQGTLFGAGSQGGTVRFITPEPTLDRYTGYNRAIISTTKNGAISYEAGGAIGGPLVEDKLGFRVSGWYSREGGFIDRLTEQGAATASLEVEDDDSNSADSYVVRADLKWVVNENITITPSFYFQRQERNDTSVFWVEDTGPAPLTATFANAYVAPATFSSFEDGEFVNGDPTQQRGTDRFLLPSLKAEVDFDFATLVVVGSYFDREQVLDDDFTTFDQVLFTSVTNGAIAGVSPFGFSRPVLPGQNATSFDVNSQENWTFEARLQSNPDQFGRFQWVAGVFYSDNEQTAVQRVEDLFLGQVLDTQFRDLFGTNVGGLFLGDETVDPILAFFGIPLVEDRFIFDNLEVANDKQLAGFAQVDFEIIDNLTLTAGVRVSKTEFSIFNEVVGPVLGPFTSDNVSAEETPITPRFAISYQPQPEHLFYASASKGFRIGGSNAAVGLPCGVGGDENGDPAAGTALGIQGLTDRPVSFDSDTLWSYEVGAKNSFMGGMLTTDVAAFHIDWSNIQQNVQLPACGFRYFSNVGSAKITGFEIAATLNPVENLYLTTAIGYTDARISETAFATPESEALGALPLVVDGDALGGPPLTVNVTVEYRFPDLYEGAFIRFDWDRTGHETGQSVFNNPENGQFDPTFVPQPVTNFVSMRLGVQPIEGFEVSAFVLNLLDSAPELNRLVQPGGTLVRAQTFRPRTIGLRGIYRF